MTDKRALLALFIPAAMVIAGCTSSPEPGTSNNISQTQEVESVTPQSVAKGEAASNGGAIITVKEASIVPVVDLEEAGVKKGMGTIAPEAPRQQGAEFARVVTTVKNEGMKPWDLTCGYAIDVRFNDSKGREYEPFDNLHHIPENPECNASLGPGFEHAMTWVFEVPTGTSIEGARLAFFDPETNYDNPTFIELS